METRIGNDIILDVDPKVFGISGTDSIESTEAIFVRYEEPCCHDNCCSQFCNPAPCCNGGCNYYNASPVNIYGIPTHCPPTKQYQYVDKINTVRNTNRIKYNYPGSKQAVCGLFEIIIVAYLKNKKTSTIKLDDTVRIVENGVQETITIKVDTNITTSGGTTIDPTNIPTGINLSYFSNKLTIALKNDNEDIGDTYDIPEATSTKNGLMSSKDKNKLDSITQNNDYSFTIKDNWLIITDINTNATYKTAVVVSETVPDTPTSGYNVYIGFGKETISSISDITSLSNAVHYVLEDVSNPDTEDGAYHIISTSENIKNTNADNKCYIWVCSQQCFKILTSNGITMPSESVVKIDNYYCKRVSNPITIIGDNIIEIIK